MFHAEGHLCKGHATSSPFIISYFSFLLQPSCRSNSLMSSLISHPPPPVTPADLSGLHLRWTSEFPFPLFQVYFWHFPPPAILPRSRKARSSPLSATSPLMATSVALRDFRYRFVPPHSFRAPAGQYRYLLSRRAKSPLSGPFYRDGPFFPRVNGTRTLRDRPGRTCSLGRETRCDATAQTFLFSSPPFPLRGGRFEILVFSCSSCPPRSPFPFFFSPLPVFYKYLSPFPFKLRDYRSASDSPPAYGLLANDLARVHLSAEDTPKLPFIDPVFHVFVLLLPGLQKFSVSVSFLFVSSLIILCLQLFPHLRVFAR